MKSTALFWLKVLVLAGAGVWVYSAAWHGTWVWDDAVEVVRRDAIRSSWNGLGHLWLAPGTADYLPLKDSVQWLEWHLWGDDPFGFHLTNLLLHLASAALVWRLLVRLGVPFAWTAAVAFTVHPVAVESVAWISELKNTLSMPLILGAALAYVSYDDEGRGPNSGGRGAYVLALALFLAAMFAKSSVVMFPCLILVFAWSRRGSLTRRDLFDAAPFFAISAALGAATIWFQEHRAISGVVAEGPGVLGTLAIAGHAVVFYAATLVVPWDVGPAYRPWPVGQSLWADVWPWAAILACGLVLWRYRSSCGRRPILAAAWFLLNLVPVLGFVRMSFTRLSPVSDHFAYLSLVAVVGGAAGLAGQVAQRAPGMATRCLLATLGLGLLVAMGAYARSVAGHYQGDESFWTFAAEQNPQAWIPQNDLGMIALSDGRLEEARARFERVVQSGQQQAEVFNNLASVYIRQGRYSDAIALYGKALALQPGYPLAESNLANAYVLSHQFPEAIVHYRRSLELRPDVPDVHLRLGIVLAQTGQDSDAASEFARALALDPGAADPHYRLGNLLANHGRLSEALEQYQAAVRLKPDDAEAYAAIGLALTLSGRPSDALQPLARASALDPTSADARAYAGFALARLGRPREAISAYRQALAIAPNNADIWFNLADALRAVGDSDGAQQAVREAARLQRSGTP